MHLALESIDVRSSASIAEGSHITLGVADKYGKTSTNPVISVPCLGTYGRWGNAVLQYMFFKAMSLRCGRSLETPLWLGKHIFELPESEISQTPEIVIFDTISKIVTLGPSRTWPFDYIEKKAQHFVNAGRYPMLLGESNTELGNHSLPSSHIEMDGFFFVNTKHLAAQKDLLLNLLEPSQEIRKSLEPSIEKLRARGRTIVGIHIRRGDFVGSLTHQGFEITVPLKKYRAWLNEIWPTLDAPVLFISSDEHSIVKEFSEFSPITAQDLGATMPERFKQFTLSQGQCQQEASFFPDWYLLSLCDVLVISNSTFSFTSALFNRRAHLFVRPTFEHDFVRFDPWKSEPLLFFTPSRSMILDSARRVLLEVKSTRLRRLPRATRKAIQLWKITVKERILLHHRHSGLKGLIRGSLTPQLYLSLHYRVK